MITGANSDGNAANPMTAPSSSMQSKLIQDTLAKANVDAEDVQFVEMHGTCYHQKKKSHIIVYIKFKYNEHDFKNACC